MAIRLFVTLISKFADSVLPRRQVRSNAESVTKPQSIPPPVQWSRLLPSEETEVRLNGVCASGEEARVLADEMVAHCTMPSLDEVLDAVQAVRQKYAPKVRDLSVRGVGYLH